MDHIDHMAALATLQGHFAAGPRQITMGRATATEAHLWLQAWDLGRPWQLSTSDPATPSAKASGTASVLPLMLWGRVDRESVIAKGDASVLETFLSEALTP